MTEPEQPFEIADQEFDPAIPVDSISEHPRNPNEGDVGAIHLSIGKHKFVGAIIVQKSTRYILAGNHTYRTACQRGATHLPGFWWDVDDAQAMQYMMDANHTARLGHDDPVLAAALLSELMSSGAGLPATYTTDDLDDLLSQLPEPLPPGGFPEFGDDLKTEHTCPRCGYAWSGIAGDTKPAEAAVPGAGHGGDPGR